MDERAQVQVTPQKAQLYATVADSQARRVVNSMDRELKGKQLPEKALTLLLVSKLIRNNVDFIYLKEGMTEELVNLDEQTQTIYNLFFTTNDNAKKKQPLEVAKLGCEIHNIIDFRQPSCRG